MHIIIRDKNKIKGKTLSEFQDNLASEGFPPEMSDTERDRVRSFEKRHGRRMRKEDIEKMGGR